MGARPNDPGTHRHERGRGRQTSGRGSQTARRAGNATLRGRVILCIGGFNRLANAVKQLDDLSLGKTAFRFAEYGVHAMTSLLIELAGSNGGAEWSRNSSSTLGPEWRA